jgi:putative Holliday junction resolvase
MMNSKHTTEQPLTLLGFDYGTSFIGVAVGQTLTRTAQPLAIINAKQGKPNWQQLEKLIKNWSPDGFVVGIPTMMDGTEQTITELSRQFAHELETRFSKPVYLVDERLTTREACAQLFEKRGYKGLDKGSVDKRSAVIILEAWLQQFVQNNF